MRERARDRRGDLATGAAIALAYTRMMTEQLPSGSVYSTAWTVPSAREQAETAQASRLAELCAVCPLRGNDEANGVEQKPAVSQASAASVSTSAEEDELVQLELVQLKV